MEYLTQLLGRAVVDTDGERFGRIAEVVVTPADPLPLVAAYQVKTEDGAVFLPWDALSVREGARDLALRRPVSDIPPYHIQPQDFSLARDVLDKQIVDVHDFRVVRVNDIRLQVLKNERLALLGVDAGMRGLLRRMGLEGAALSLGRFLHRAPSLAGFIAWNDVESLPTHNAGEPLKLKVSHEKLSQLHPADIGDILNQMEPAQRRELLESLDVETAAEALAEADDDVQVAALQHLDEERAADILEEMGADEAADVLGDMDKAHRDDLLGRIDDAEYREDLEELLTYHDETAGGMMTSEYVAIEQGLTAQQTIDRLRELEPEAETIYYLYVVDAKEHLVGVVSLRDLIIAAPGTMISEFMITKVRAVPVDADVEKVARLFERYSLLALPVVDGENVMQGIITIDDTLEQLLPDDWRKRRRTRESEGSKTAAPV